MDSINIQDIFNRFYPDYLETYTPSAQQAKSALHIINCKTGAYGSTISICEDCGHIEFQHNSCRDRNCPMCQELPKEKWLDAQRECLLDTTYYHVVFTVPHDLNPLFYCSQKELYGLLFHSAAETLLELSADKKYLGAKPGFTSILQVNYYQNGLQIEIVYCMILTVSGSFLERSLYGKIIKIVECKGQRNL